MTEIKNLDIKDRDQRYKATKQIDKRRHKET